MKTADRRYIVTLAAVATGILVVGYWLRPNQPATEQPVQAPSETELSRLTRITQRRSLDDITEYFAMVADDVRSGIVELPGLDRSGLMWEPGVVLTARTEPRFPLATTVTTPGADIGGASIVFGPQLPIATVRMSEVPGLAPPRRRPAINIQPGSWVLAIWRRARETHFVPAHFLNSVRTDCSAQTIEELRSNVVWSRDMAGGGLFDLDGRLIGVIVPCGNRFAAATVDSVDALLDDGRTVEGRLLGRYGIRFEFLSEDEHRHFGREGVIVREVWSGYLADVAGLSPGDILVAVNAEPIGTPDQLEPLLNAADVESFHLAVQRNEEIVEIVLPADPTVLDHPHALGATPGIMWEPEPVGHLIDAVMMDSPADAAGIQGGDRLAGINGETPEDLNQVMSVLGTDRVDSVFLEIERSGRRWGVLLP